MKIEDIDQKIGMPDVDKEWTRFESEVIGPARHELRPQRSSSGWHRAAIVTLVCGLGVVALASVLYVGFFRQEPMAPASTIMTETTAPADALTTEDTEEDCFVFDDVELQQIADELASHYGVEARFDNAEARPIRLYVTIDKQMTLSEVVEYLNNLQGVNLRLENQLLIVE